MGSGKSVIGKRLAEKLNLEFIDLDDQIEYTYKMTIPALFNQFGEDMFRNLETRTLQQQIQSEDYVLSCGGGTPCFHNNMKLINENGTSVYIKMEPKDLAERISKSRKNRPLMKNIAKDNLVEEIEKLLTHREQFYSQANIVIEGNNLNIEDLVDRVENFKL